MISGRLLEEGLLAGLQESVLRPEVAEYTLQQFENKLLQAASTKENSLVALEKRRSHIEGRSRIAPPPLRTDSRQSSYSPNLLTLSVNLPE